jgi:hypothetical protein
MLHYHTVNGLLKECLLQLMKADAFASFRLVGGTALSLQLGHRQSIDIDLFSDVEYGSIDFAAIEDFLGAAFAYTDRFSDLEPAMGKSYIIGADRNHAVKLDVFYTDTFIESTVVAEGIRLASVAEIAAMKMDVVQRGGRKKDFWDMHELMERYGIEEMIGLHLKRYEYSHDRTLIIKNLTDFSQADNDFDPICLRGKHWEFIKADIAEAVNRQLRI